MFPKSAVIMLLVAGLLLLIAMAIDAFTGKEVNQIYLWTGAVLVVFSTGMLLFKKK